MILHSNYLSKSNLNYINCKNYEGISLLTQLMRRLRFKSCGLKCIFSGFVFDMRSAFKGQFQSILATICDLYCFNIIAVEFRTQGDYEELKILL